MIFKNSETFFNYVIATHKIELDENFENLKYLYNKNIYFDAEGEAEAEAQSDATPDDINIDETLYEKYFQVFDNYYEYKDMINIIYYIAILFYLNYDMAYGLIRYFVVSLKNFVKMMHESKDKKDHGIYTTISPIYNEIAHHYDLYKETMRFLPSNCDRYKTLTLEFITNSINQHIFIFLFFIYCVQNYL